MSDELPKEVKAMVAMAARGYLAEMRGEYCTCAEPDIEGRKASLCFKCGLVNRDRKRAVAAAMRAPHPFEPKGDGPIMKDACAFCAFWREDPRHTA